MSPQFLLPSSINNDNNKNKIRKIVQTDGHSLSEFGEYLDDGGKKETTHNNNNQMEQMTKYYESQLLSLKIEYEMNINNKESQIKELQNVNYKLINEFQIVSNDKKQLYEENNILKKAVSIQDNRYKDLYNQNIQLNNVLAQAANCINELRNSRGESCSNCCVNNYSSFPPPPPDVY